MIRGHFFGNRITTKQRRFLCPREGQPTGKMSYGLIYPSDPAHVFNQTVMERATVHTRYLILRLKWTLNHVSCNVRGSGFFSLLTRYVAMTTHISPADVLRRCKYIGGGWNAVGKQVMRLMTHLTCKKLFPCTNRTGGNCQLPRRVASPWVRRFPKPLFCHCVSSEASIRVRSVLSSFI